MEKNEFQCAICKKVFIKDTDDEAAMEEYREKFDSSEHDKAKLAVVCEICYAKMEKAGIFLEEKLLKLGRETSMDIGSLAICLTSMFNLCMEEARNCTDNMAVIFRAWESVADKLRAENRTFMARNGLRIIMNQRLRGDVNPQSN